MPHGLPKNRFWRAGALALTRFLAYQLQEFSKCRDRRSGAGVPLPAVAARKRSLKRKRLLKRKRSLKRKTVAEAENGR
jgi:hypothetical protein